MSNELVEDYRLARVVRCNTSCANHTPQPTCGVSSWLLNQRSARKVL